MTIANGQTMVIGGIIREDNSDELSSVPLVADIPYLRRLFGNTSQYVKRTEMLVLITGYIINEKSPVEEMVRRYNNSVRSLSVFERKLETEHARDMERLRRTRKEQEALKRARAASKPAVDTPKQETMNPAYEIRSNAVVEP